MIRNLLLLAMAQWMVLSTAWAQSIVCALPPPSGGNQIMPACSSIKDKVVTLGLKHSRMLSSGSCVNVLTLDLDQPGLQLAAHGALEEACQTVSARAVHTQAIAAVNGGFFCNGTPSLCASSYSQCPTNCCAGFSLLKANGHLQSTNCSPLGESIPRTTLGWTDPSHPKIQRIPSGQDWKEVSNALGAGPTLVTDGNVNVTNEGFGWECQAHPRTAVGLTQDHQLVIVTVDSPGWMLPDLAQFLIQQLHVKEAMNFDGGGSTTMVIHGQVVNQPSEGHERPVYDSLEIVSTSAAAQPKAEKP